MAKRKLFRLALSLALCIGIMPASAAFASESEIPDNYVVFTEDMAKTAAEDFSEAVNPGGRLTAGEPVKFYDLEGNAIGYTVNYYKDGASAGYVVFDNGDESLISQYSFSSESMSPTDVAVEYASDQPSVLSDSPDGHLKNYKIGPFSYAVIDENTGEGITNYGEEIAIAEVAPLSSTPDSGSWQNPNIWIPYGSNPGNYALGEGRNIGSSIAFPERDIESMTGTYACVISALLPSVFYYGAPADIKTAYGALWDLSGTTVDHVSNGITYGSTKYANAGPAFKTYMSNYHGINVNYRFVEGPNYQFFKSMINGGNIGVFGANILVNGNYPGHGVSVQGYQTMLDRNQNLLMETLVVFDGWYAGWANINLNYAGYTATYGISFSR
ncbi:hypothetical protein [Gordonibacter urolithinfaciens]|uniref:hypothetical protein n=1 Tax=Gordonibacter urolithinfaciens TaxID=1335613 RepID=UPI001D61AC48|nr:hypothetical protein [Gordonibacter urolithinfaciens]HJF62122.1 hypothetical protein [Gordonibacter urolithinfaciens]